MIQFIAALFFWWFMALTPNGYYGISATHGPFATHEECDWGRYWLVMKLGSKGNAMVSMCWETK